MVSQRISAGLLLATVMFAAVTEASRAQSTVPGQKDALGRVRIVSDEELKRNNPFAIIHDMPMSENEALIPRLMADADTKPPQYLYELARRLWLTDHQAAFEWLALGMARARYDALRCTDKTARQGVAYLGTIAPDVLKGIEQERRAFGEAGKRALARPNVFVDSISPIWICSHGISMMRAALGGKPLTERDWLLPEAEWPALREQVRADLARYFDEQGKPQDDPVPMSKTHYSRQVLPANFGSYRWLDDDHLVAAVPEKSIDGKFVARLVSIDSTSKQTVVTSLNNFWCAGNGVVAYQTGSEKLDNRRYRVTVDVGQPGKWVTQTLELSTPFLNVGYQQNFGQTWMLPANSLRQSPIDCHWEDNEHLSGPGNATHWLPLLPGDGAIQYDPPGPRNIPNGVSWVSAGGEVKRLPNPAQQLTLDSFHYYSWRQAYFATPLWSRFSAEGGKAPQCVPAAWIHPKQQRIEEVCVPFDTANTSNAVVFMPVRAGWLRIASARNTAHGPRPGGLYLVRDNGQTEKLVETEIESWNPSPDGCRLAFKHRPQSNTAPVLEVIDLCRAS